MEAAMMNAITFERLSVDNMFPSIAILKTLVNFTLEYRFSL